MLVEAWEGEISAKLRTGFPGVIEQTAQYLGQPFAIVSPGSLVPVIRHLKLEEGFDMLIDLTAVDYPKRERRFELVYELHSFSRNERRAAEATTSVETPLRPS